MFNDIDRQIETKPLKNRVKPEKTTIVMYMVVIWHW